MGNGNRETKIITCAGYYGTGSSAVTDFFSEFENCSSPGDHEFRFIHDPDGIRDLEYQLIENNNRHNTSNAIKRYIKFVKQFDGGVVRKGYKKYMGNVFLESSYEYIGKIVELECESWWYYDRIEKGRIFYLLDSAIERLGDKLFQRKELSWMNLLHEKAFFSAIDKELFYKYTREYIRKVLGAMNVEHSEYLMVDQLLPPSNVNRYLNYFDDIRVVVVDRDPRDVYLLAKNVWHTHVVPHKDVRDFCKWYEIIRRHRETEEYDRSKIYFLQFEDLIYRYEETVARLTEFVGINREKHVLPRACFDPAASIHNTDLAARYPKDQKDVEYIERKLGKYVYDFPDENLLEEYRRKDEGLRW